MEDIKVQVCLFAFDLLFLNGKGKDCSCSLQTLLQSFLKEPLQVRRQALHSSFQEIPGQFTFAKYKDTSDVEEIQSFLAEAVEGNCEGLMIKTLKEDATYEPSRRSFNWLKVSISKHRKLTFF